MSSPTRRSVYEQEMFWVNPCGGVRNTDYEASPDYAKATTSIAEVLDTIILPANLSLTQAKLFREEYVWKTFEHDFTTQQEMWSFQRVNFDWLPSKEQVPKELGEHLSYEYLESLKIDDILLDTYHFLQMMAVGLEQVAADQIENNGDFIEKFDSVKNQLRSLLCEYHSTIEERKLSMQPDVTREIMNKEMRHDKNDTNRKMRDWVIFRDYMNLLEYIIEVFEYFKKNPAKLGPS